jgi:hypothetical protein
MDAILTYAMSFSPGPHKTMRRIDNCGRFFVIEEREVYISYCADKCGPVVIQQICVPFTVGELCTMVGPISKSCNMCTWCLATAPKEPIDECCRYYHFGSLCASCNKNTQRIRDGLAAKRMLLGALLLPELAAAIVGLMWQLPARD